MDETLADEAATPTKLPFLLAKGSPEARERAIKAAQASARKRTAAVEQRAAETAIAHERETDGWTAKKQIAFLRDLAEDGNAAAAARAQGFTGAAAYGLKRRDAAFSARWDQARDQHADATEARVTAMALDGIEKEVVHKGEVRRLRSHSDRLLSTVLTRRRPETGGAAARFAMIAEASGALPPGKAGEAARLKFEATMAEMARKLDEAK